MASTVLAGVLAACGVVPDRQAPPMVPDLPKDRVNVLYIHHSTGQNIWDGGVQTWLNAFNTREGTTYNIVERAFPNSPYPWANNPYDYWQLWVNHSAPDARKGQATLDTLATAYDVVVWKNCFVASDISTDNGKPDVTSDIRTIANYKLQYNALRAKMKEYPKTKFIVWTLPPMVPGDLSADKAARAQEFASWVSSSWNEPGDNVYLWDFRSIALDGIYLRQTYAVGEKDSHPNPTLSKKAAAMFGQRLVDVIEGRGDAGPVAGA